jgi:predicted nucleic acid-binding protein
LSRLVLDASVTLAWAFEDQTTRYSEGVLERLAAGEAVVPAVWPLEVANALVSAERRGKLTRAKTTGFLLAFQGLAIVIDADGPSRAFTEVLSLAREHRLSAYDASYLDLALRAGVPLATLDQDLRKAAEALGVNILKVE